MPSNGDIFHCSSYNTPPNARMRMCPSSFTSPSTSFDTASVSSPVKWSLEEVACSHSEELDGDGYVEHRTGLPHLVQQAVNSSPIYEIPLGFHNADLVSSNNNNSATLVRPQTARNPRCGAWSTNATNRCFSMTEEWTKASVSPHLGALAFSLVMGVLGLVAELLIILSPPKHI